MVLNLWAGVQEGGGGKISIRGSTRPKSSRCLTPLKKQGVIVLIIYNMAAAEILSKRNHPLEITVFLISLKSYEFQMDFNNSCFLPISSQEFIVRFLLYV